MASVSAFCTVKSTLCRMVSSPLASATRLLRPATTMAAWPDALAGTVPRSDMDGESGMKLLDALGNSGMVFLKKLRQVLWLPVAALFLFSAAASAYSAPKTVLVLGDSLSAEYGLARGAGWVALLEQKLQAQKIDARIVNASVSGETTSGGRTRLPALLSKHQPSIVVIELGANDGLRGLPVAAAEANLRAMVKQSREAGAQVLLVGMRMPPNYGRDYADKFFAMFARFQQAQGQLSGALSRLIAVSENYPQLKADAGFRDLQAQLEGTENRIAVARNRYIKSVQDYNVTVRSFPTNLVAMMFGHDVKPNFSVENEKAISTPPAVNFDAPPKPQPGQ
eukprot:gene32599-40229_t